MKWEVRFTRQFVKQVRHLSEKAQLVLQVLVDNLSTVGPAPGRCWRNYGKLRSGGGQDNRHCHLFKGRPTLVCCRRAYRGQRVIEVYYVGTHEKAPH